MRTLNRLILLLIALIVLLTQMPGYADDTANVMRLNSLQVFTGPLDAVDFNVASDMLASGGRDNMIRLWNTRTGENMLTFYAHDNWVTSVVFAPDGATLYSGSRDNSIRQWDVVTGQLLRVIGHHRGDITALALTPDGTILASGARDGAIKLFHVGGNYDLIAELDSFGGPVWDIEFSHDGTMLAAGAEDGAVWMWGLWHENGPWLKKLIGHDGPVTRIAYSDDDRYMLSGGLDSTLRLWNIENPGTKVEITTPEYIMRGHLAPIMGLGFGADGSIATTASLDGTFRIWDIAGVIEAGSELSMIMGNGAPLTHMAINKNRDAAASVGTDGVMTVWDVSQETIKTLIDSRNPATIAQVPDDEKLAETSFVPGEPVSPGIAIVEPSPTPQPRLAPNTPVPPRPTARPQPTAIPQIPAPPPASGGRTLHIPSIGLNSSIKTFYLDGVSWAIDPWEHLVGHFQGTAWFDRVGNMALGAHSEYPDGSPGLFHGLYGVGIGDEIYVRDGDQERRYVVVNILSVDYRDLSVVYPTSHNRLTLVTCDIPSYVAEQGIYYERLIIQADEV